MNTKMTGTEVRKLYEAAGSLEEFLKALETQWWQDGDEELGGLARLVMDRRGRLADYAAQVERKARETRERINHKALYSGVNSSGELQYSATGFDIACALYDEAFGRLSSAISQREREESRAKFVSAREALAGTVDWSVLENLELSRGSLKQLAVNLATNEVIVGAALTRLIALGFVRRRGTEKRPTFNPATVDQWLDHQVTLAAVAAGKEVVR